MPEEQPVTSMAGRSAGQGGREEGACVPGRGGGGVRGLVREGGGGLLRGASAHSRASQRSHHGFVGFCGGRRRRGRGEGKSQRGVRTTKNVVRPLFARRFPPTPNPHPNPPHPPPTRSHTPWSTTPPSRSTTCRTTCCTRFSGTWLLSSVVLSIEPRNVKTLLRLAAACERSGDVAAAAAEYEAALVVDPGSEQARKGLARVRRR